MFGLVGKHAENKEQSSDPSAKVPADAKEVPFGDEGEKDKASDGAGGNGNDTEASGTNAAAETSAVLESTKTSNSNWDGISHKIINMLTFKKGESVKAYQDLASDDVIMKHSLAALKFNVVCSAINTKLLNPNFAIMAADGAHEDSFSNTDPFDFNSATYFLPLSSLMGVAIASIFTGQWSDRFGRFRVIQISTILAGFGSIGMYLARDTFWGFCGASFAAGLFKGTLPVAMAYIGDVFTESKKEKEDQLSFIVGCYVLGNSGGGIFAILMEDSGLFTPLLLGAGFVFLSAVVNACYLIEPSKEVSYTPIGKDKVAEDAENAAIEKQKAGVEVEEDEEDAVVRPETIDKGVMWHIVAGALADNVGSTALFPLCLSPLALEQYNLDFRTAGEDPIMTIDLYKWLSVLVALMVIPGTLITPKVFSWIGAAGGCVFGNIATGLLTLALLLIGNGSATNAMFGLFVGVMYAGFPFTVVSQLSTGPLLDLIAPLDKLGYVQGLNNTVMNFGMAIAPWIFGILADAIGTNPAIWIGIGISFGAALINLPLMWIPGMGVPKKKVAQEKRWVKGEDEEFVQKALSGSFVDPEALLQLNLERARHGQKALVPGIRSYEDDKEQLDVLRSRALTTFKDRKAWHDTVLSKLASPEYKDRLPEICEALNRTKEADPEEIAESHQLLGQWFGDYLRDAGYEAQINPIVIKQLVLSAFPPINPDHELNPENIEQVYLRARRVLNHYLDVKKKEQYSYSGLFGNGGAPVYYS